jgi:hypothetical protein
MRRISFYFIQASMLIVACSCSNHNVTTNNVDKNKDSISEINQEYEYQDQRELNEHHATWMLEYNDSIEKEFQDLLSALPQYREIFDKEKKNWEKYQKVVREMANCEDHGSSTSMFIDDLLNQGISLREASFRNLQLHLRGKSVLFSKTTFTPEMISNAYSAFIKAVGDDDYNRFRAKYQEKLRKEQQLWDEWMRYRNQVSQKLPKEIKSVYEKCTNQMMRTKLIHLKNQNQGLGMIGSEVVGCILPENCTDKALVEYPGFDVIWAKHSENTDWYPKFE